MELGLAIFQSFQSQKGPIRISRVSSSSLAIPILAPTTKTNLESRSIAPASHFGCAMVLPRARSLVLLLKQALTRLREPPASFRPAARL